MADSPTRTKVATTLARWRRFEFWPPWLFYPPVVLSALYHSARHRGFLLPLAANPAMPFSGLIGESKSEIDALLPPAPWKLALTSIATGPTETRMQTLEEFLAWRALTFPIVLKPDVGQRGASVRIIRNREQARAYLADHPIAVVAQELSTWPEEVGLFFARQSSRQRYRVISVTQKEFPSVLGDGKHDLGALIDADPRARLIRHVYAQRLDLTQVPEHGETVPLVECGNHCQGTIFRDGKALIDETLERRVTKILTGIEGVHVGRMDIRFRDWDAFLAGEDFHLIELNGAGAEVTHIWDPDTRLRDAYRALHQQWGWLYRAGAVNRREGNKVPSWRELARAWFAGKRAAKYYQHSD